MIIVPKDVRCNFCRRTFCCADCRERHEEKVHEEALQKLRDEERIKASCHLCHYRKLVPLPLIPMSLELGQHIAEFHLPLQCGKCLKLFETLDDLKNYEKCCLTISTESNQQTENLMEDKMSESSSSGLKVDVGGDKILTPLSKINMLWRRKSKDFGKSHEFNQDGQAGAVTRQTSTPMQRLPDYIDSSSNIHISSINCSGNSSSESETSSPPLAAPVTSPKRGALDRSRPKLPKQATPYRQIMSRSIQRAFAAHGHYRETPAVSQLQRKMSFSSASSTEHSSQSMKLTDAPLDLRTSPTLRRLKSETEKDFIQYHSQSFAIEGHIEVKQIEVIIRRSEIKSDTTAITNYMSCVSDSGRSGSMPELQCTPKLVGNNFMKKVIMFEAPGSIERTPSFLFPLAARINEDDDDVFYTPIASPGKARTSSEVMIPIEDSHQPPDEPATKPRGNIWNLVSSVIQIASKARDEIGETLTKSDNTWKFNFKKPEFVKKATDYFTKRSVDTDEQTSKRRRTNSNNENRTESQSSPATKRQKIQPRKPIGRMRLGS